MRYMFIAYDVKEGRTDKPRKFLRRYLLHVQDSVFEGEVNKTDSDEIVEWLQSYIDSDERCRIIILESDAFVDKISIGEDPTDEHRFI